MSIKSGYPHTNLDELVKVKIPALGRRGAENNKAILKNLAMNGPSLKYDVCKNLKLPRSHYGTISRRMDALKKGGYLAEAGKRPTERGKQTEQSLYGLTWRGFIASLSINEVRENAFQVLEKNPLLTLPAKEFILGVLKETYDPKRFEKIVTSFFHDFLTTAPSLEEIEEEDFKVWLLLSAMRRISTILEEVMRRENLLRLFDDPRIFQYVRKIIPSLKADFENQIRNLSISVEILDEINSIRPGEKPSEKLKEFFRSVEK